MLSELVVKAYQLGLQDHLIRWYWSELKRFQDINPIVFQGHFIRCPSTKDLPRCRVDVVHNRTHIPLGQELETGASWKNHAEHGVCLFNAALLSAAHGITVVNAASYNSMDPVFEGLRITEFRAAVGQYGVEQSQEVISAKLVFQTVKDHADSPFGIAVHQKSQEQLFTGEEKRQNGLPGSTRRMNSIHFRKAFKPQRLEVGIKASGKDLPVFDLRFMHFPRFELDLPFQIDVPR